MRFALEESFRLARPNYPLRFFSGASEGWFRGEWENFFFGGVRPEVAQREKGQSERVFQRCV
jgi:hypothetical protein